MCSVQLTTELKSKEAETFFNLQRTAGVAPQGRQHGEDDMDRHSSSTFRARESTAVSKSSLYSPAHVPILRNNMSKITQT